MSSRAYTGLLGVDDSRGLLRVSAALQRLTDDVETRALSAASQQLSSGWLEELNASSVFSDQQRKIVTASPKAVARAIGLTVSTGGVGELGELTKAFEFGVLNRDEFRQYTRRSPSGTVVRRPGSLTTVAYVHIVNRRTKRQMPSRSQTGWVAYPATRRLKVRVVRMFQQIVVKVAHDAVEAGR